CYIADCGHQGVISYSGAKINLTGNIITGSKYHAVRNTGGTLSMKNNLIINNANRGIYLGNKTGQGKIYSNIIIGNGTGIGCFAGSKYDILYNIIMNNSYSGISMEKSCRLGMKGNILAGNERGLVMFDRGEQGSNDVRANTFWNNKTNAENITLPGTTITEEPQFRDAPNGDFSLTEGTVKEKQQGLTNADAKELWTLWVKWQKRKGNQL
ncbi:MAG: right-handed parallel beta-helix repeat-containing protein, partial [Anaerohalosphaera sp.]|nr:right-handed parallel beta-helix repeat-containing protein [Anaerohalosphaera sp.]